MSFLMPRTGQGTSKGFQTRPSRALSDVKWAHSPLPLSPYGSQGGLLQAFWRCPQGEWCHPRIEALRICSVRWYGHAVQAAIHGAGRCW